MFLIFYQDIDKIPEVTCWVFKKNRSKQKVKKNQKKKKKKSSKFLVYGKEKILFEPKL